MVKSDEHMMKIRDKLLYSRKVIEMRESRRKAREQKKFGKKVQVAKLQQQMEEKKANLTALKLYKKKHGSKEFNMEDYEKDVEELRASKNPTARPPPPPRAQQRPQSSGKGGKGGKGGKSQPVKGGKSASASGGSKGGKGGGKGGVQKPQKRLGKARRQQSRQGKK
jgi:rRNA-processing protein EBP2